jgi:zinc protease
MKMMRYIVTGLFVFALMGHAADLPTAEAVFNKYIEATGGKEAYGKVNNVTSKGSMEIVGQGMKGAIVIVAARPDRMDTVVEFPGIGKMRSGLKGGVAWQSSAIQGPRVLDGEERDQLVRRARVDSAVQWKTVYGEVKVDGEDTMDGKACWRLVAHTSPTAKPQTLWFGKESGMLMKTSATMVSAMGELPVESTYEDYREVGGVKMPFKMTQKMGPQAIQTTIEEVKINSDLPATQFDIPAEVQPLIKK